MSKSVSEGTQSLTLKSPLALISETDKSPHSLSPAVAHIDASLITLPDTEPSSSQPLKSSGDTGSDAGVSGELISKGFSLESSVDPPSLSTYMSSTLSSLPHTGSNVAMTLTGPIGSFGFNSQKLLSPAEFVSSPPHSLSSFSKVTPSDFSSALPSVTINTSVASPTTPTSNAVLTSVAPPSIASAEDSSNEVIVESSSNTDSDDDKVTPQEMVQLTKSFQDTSETPEPPQSEVNLSKMLPEVSTADVLFHTEFVNGDTNKSLTSQHNQASEVDGLSPQQKSELLQIEGRVSQTSSEFASANEQESECEEDSPINTANNLVDTKPYSKPQSKVDSSQLFPSVPPGVTVQSLTADSITQPTNNNLQFIQCNECSTFNSSDVLKCSHCERDKNDQWTPQNFPKAMATQNSSDFMIAQSPSTVDAVAANESAVEPSAIDSNVSPISYTALLTAAPDHGRVNTVVTESPRSSVVTQHNSSSATATSVDTGHSTDTHLLSSTSEGSSSYSTNQLTR